jgi:hypothetical protein
MSRSVNSLGRTPIYPNALVTNASQHTPIYPNALVTNASQHLEEEEDEASSGSAMPSQTDIHMGLPGPDSSELAQDQEESNSAHPRPSSTPHLLLGRSANSIVLTSICSNTLVTNAVQHQEEEEEVYTRENRAGSAHEEDKNKNEAMPSQPGTNIDSPFEVSCEMAQLQEESNSHDSRLSSTPQLLLGRSANSIVSTPRCSNTLATNAVQHLEKEEEEDVEEKEEEDEVVEEKEEEKEEEGRGREANVVEVEEEEETKASEEEEAEAEQGEDVIRQPAENNLQRPVSA